MSRFVQGFDWDAGNRDKCQKHGLTLEEIESVFMESPRIAPDLKHSIAEERLVAYGRTEEGRLAFVVFTFRERNGESLIRPVSARYMGQKEAKRFEESSEIDDG